MTRKDYALLAEALAVSRPEPLNVGDSLTDSHFGAVQQWQWDRAAIANRLQADNPRFDRERFYAATEE